jgi:glutaredoxin
MEIIIYSMPGCKKCHDAKKILNKKELTYQEIMIDRDIKLEDFLKKYPTIYKFPFVLIDGSPINHVSDFIKK